MYEINNILEKYTELNLHANFNISFKENTLVQYKLSSINMQNAFKNNRQLFWTIPRVINIKLLHSNVLTNEIPAGKSAHTNTHLKKAAITLVLTVQSHHMQLAFTLHRDREIVLHLGLQLTIILIID